MKQAWRITAAVAALAATAASGWAQRAQLPSLPVPAIPASIPIGEIGVPIPLNGPPRPAAPAEAPPLPDNKPSSTPVTIPITRLPSPGPPPEMPRAAPGPAAGGAAMCAAPTGGSGCRRLASRFRKALGGCCCWSYWCWGCNPPSPAESVAARVRAEEACAPARLCAVHYLGTVDCHFYPEAEEALIAALRCDRNCCVRLEAACALGNVCCGTRRVIEALTVVVAAREDDGNPGENCEQVRRAAFVSLHKLLASNDAAAQAHPGLANAAASGRMSAALAQARLTMAQVAGTPWAPSRSTSTGPYLAGYSRQALENADAVRPKADEESTANHRYFPLHGVAESLLAARRRPHRAAPAAPAAPVFDLPKVAAIPAAATPQRTITPCALAKSPPNGSSPACSTAPQDSADVQVLPVLIPAAGMMPASAVDDFPRSLLPAGLSPLGRVPE